MTRFFCDAEREIYEKRGPARHRSIARQIDDQMTLPRLLPYRFCNCDEGHHCRPHAAIHRIIDRAYETGRPKRARAAVERFVRRFVAAKESR